MFWKVRFCAKTGPRQVFFLPQIVPGLMTKQGKNFAVLDHWRPPLTIDEQSALFRPLLTHSDQFESIQHIRFRLKPFMPFELLRGVLAHFCNLRSFLIWNHLSPFQLILWHLTTFCSFGNHPGHFRNVWHDAAPILDLQSQSNLSKSYPWHAITDSNTTKRTYIIQAQSTALHCTCSTWGTWSRGRRGGPRLGSRSVGHLISF